MDAQGQLMGAMEVARRKAIAAGLNTQETQAMVTGAGFGFLLNRIEQLEALPFEYAGIHETHKTYRKNQFVTHGGRVWACMADYTIQQPGTTEDWKLAVNKGRDGRDAKDFK